VNSKEAVRKKGRKRVEGGCWGVDRKGRKGGERDSRKEYRVVRHEGVGRVKLAY